MHPAVFVLDGNFLPPLTRARNDDAHFLPKFPGRNRRLVPIADFAIRPCSSDRMERNHPQRDWSIAKGRDPPPLMTAIGPVEPRPVHKETFVFKSGGKRRFSTFPFPPAPSAVKGRNLRNQQA